MTARGLFYTPAGSLRAVWRWVGFLLVGYAALRVAGPVIALLGRRLGVRSPLALAEFTLLAAMLVAHAVMLRLVDRLPWTFVGLGRSQAGGSRLATGLAVGAVGILLPSGVLLLVHWLRAVPNASAHDTWLGYAGASALLFLPQSLAEELLARGYLFAAVRDAAGWKWALAITSVAFGLLHAANPGADLQSILIVMLAGVFLGGVLLLTESLYAAWMAHFAWNWSMAALLHASVSGLAVSGPGYRVVDAGPDLVTGGPWGPEGGLAAVASMMLCLWILVAWHRRRVARADEPEPNESWLTA